MSPMCRFGRICVPPKTVIRLAFTAWLVRMLTVRSNRCRGEWPQIVAGRTMTGTKLSVCSGSRTCSHIALYLLYSETGTSGCSSVTSGESLTP